MESPEKALLDHLITQYGLQALALRSMADHVTALIAVLGTLDSNFEKMFAQQLAVAQQRSQSLLEQVKMQTAAMQAALSKMPN